MRRPYGLVSFCLCVQYGLQWVHQYMFWQSAKQYRNVVILLHIDNRVNIIYKILISAIIWTTRSRYRYHLNSNQHQLHSGSVVNDPSVMILCMQRGVGAQDTKELQLHEHSNQWFWHRLTLTIPACNGWLYANIILLG